MKLTFVGDIFLGDEPFYTGFGNCSQFKRHQGTIWKEALRKITDSSDVFVGNLECPLLQTNLSHRKDFHGDAKAAAFLKECGITHLNVANNHILEYGADGYNQTIEVLTKENIGVIGDKKNIITYIESDNALIAIVGFCGVSSATPDTFTEINDEKIEEALIQMKKANADLKIFYLHWGNEYIHTPSPEQRALAYKLIDAGVHFIIGHHPHTIQPYEQYNEGHIFYSLGNFCFDNPYQSDQFSKGLGVTINYNSQTKQVDDIQYFGVKLSLKGLVTKIPNIDIRTYLHKIQKSYQEVKDLSEYGYLYQKELRKRHFVERLLMKTSLIKLFIHLERDERKMLLKNLKQYYLN